MVSSKDNDSSLFRYSISSGDINYAKRGVLTEVTFAGISVTLGLELD